MQRKRFALMSPSGKTEGDESVQLDPTTGTLHAANIRTNSHTTSHLQAVGKSVISNLTVTGAVTVPHPQMRESATTRAYVDASIPAAGRGLRKVGTALNVDEDLPHVTNVGPLKSLLVEGPAKMGDIGSSGDVSSRNVTASSTIHSKELRVGGEGRFKRLVVGGGGATSTTVIGDTDLYAKQSVRIGEVSTKVYSGAVGPHERLSLIHQVDGPVYQDYVIAASGGARGASASKVEVLGGAAGTWFANEEEKGGIEGFSISAHVEEPILSIRLKNGTDDPISYTVHMVTYMGHIVDTELVREYA
jgi:hypothetical protein